MSEVPKGWAVATLEDLGKWGSGGTPKRGNGLYYGGQIPWIKSGDLPDGPIEVIDESITELGLKESSAKIFPEGTVSIAMYGATIGKLGIFTRAATTNQACANIVPADKITNQFVFYLLKNEKRNLIHKGKGGAQPNISQEVIKAHQVLLPPLAEQNRITLKLDALLGKLAEVKERLNKVPDLLKTFRQSVLSATCTGKILKRTNGAPVEGFVKVDGPMKLPDNWSWASWISLCVDSSTGFKRGPFGGSLKKSIFVKKGYKVYEQYCPINDDCSFGRYFITKEKFKEMEGFSVLPGDLLISCSGVTLGRITQVPPNAEPGIINQALLRVRLNPKKICSKFFILYFRSQMFQNLIFENSTGSAIPNVKGVKFLKELPIPLPPLIFRKKLSEKWIDTFSNSIILKACTKT